MLSTPPLDCRTVLHLDGGRVVEVVTRYAAHSSESWDHMHDDRRSYWNHRIAEIHEAAVDRATGIETPRGGEG